MIGSASQLPDGEAIIADICIVGGGAAGITLALALRDSPLRVLLLEAGGATENREGIDLYRGEVTDPALHAPAHVFRHRVLGGSTLTWGGRCVPFDRIDFEPRDWIAPSGWPIGYDEVARYYGEALRLAEAGDNIFSAAAAVDGGMRPMIEGFAPEAFDTDPIERFSCPTDFGRRYRGQLERAPNVRVLLDANCTEIVSEQQGRRVDYLEIRTLNGRRATVHSRYYVVAAGGIETARLLLASRRHDPRGIGNEHDLVGRFYMCHIAGTTGEVHLKVPPNRVFHGYEQSWDGVYCRRRLHLREAAQRRLRTGNIVLRLHHPRLADPAHRRGILSALFLARRFIRPDYARRLRGTRPITAGTLARHLLNIVSEPFETLGFLVDLVRTRALAGRRFPSLIVRPRNNVYSLDIHAEQAPNAESRITLGTETDRFGMPRVRVDWQYLAIDLDGVERALQALAADLEASGIGTLSFDAQSLATDLLRDGAFGGHHIGTTRMADAPADGVVDRNCRVHGVENLFIAGSSVFPTSGQANPTLTILALALRLAAHLGDLAAVPPRVPADAA